MGVRALSIACKFDSRLALLFKFLVCFRPPQMRENSSTISCSSWLCSVYRFLKLAMELYDLLPHFCAFLQKSQNLVKLVLKSKSTRPQEMMEKHIYVTRGLYSLRRRRDNLVGGGHESEIGERAERLGLQVEVGWAWDLVLGVIEPFLKREGKY